MSNILNVGKNNSVRAKTITVFDGAGISGRHSMKVSGHKSETSYSHFISDCTTENEAGTENLSDLASVSAGDFELDCLINEEV